MSKPWDHLSSEVLIVAGIEAALHVTWRFFAKQPQTLVENISELDCDLTLFPSVAYLVNIFIYKPSEQFPITTPLQSNL